jgi:aminopeptidase 2
MSYEAPESAGISEDRYRLPTDVKPSHYDLTVWTDLKKLKFGGFVTIRRALGFIWGCQSHNASIG